MSNYAKEQWVLTGRRAAACGRHLETALAQAPRSVERAWVREGYDAFVRENKDGE